MDRRIYQFLGLSAIAASLSLILRAPEVAAKQPPDNLVNYWSGTALLVGLCVSIAVFCFFPGSHWLTLRFLGLFGVAGSIFTLVDSIQHHEWLRLIPVFMFWLPGSIVLVRYGKMDNS